MIQTYKVEDCVKYFNQSYSSATIFDYPLPSNFKIEYERQITTNSVLNSSYIGVGESESRMVLMGKVVSTDTKELVKVRTNSSGSGDINTYGSNIIASNDYNSIYILFDGTTLDFNNDVKITNFNGVNLGKLVNYGTWRQPDISSGNIRNIKIKPL